MFADDIVLIYSGLNLGALIGHLNNRIDSIAGWCKFNNLPLNSDMHKYLFVIIRDLPMRLTISKNNTPIE